MNDFKNDLNEPKGSRSSLNDRATSVQQYGAGCGWDRVTHLSISLSLSEVLEGMQVEGLRTGADFPPNEGMSAMSATVNPGTKSVFLQTFHVEVYQKVVACNITGEENIWQQQETL